MRKEPTLPKLKKNIKDLEMQKIRRTLCKLIAAKYIEQLEHDWAIAIWNAIRAEEERDCLKLQEDNSDSN